MTQKLVLKRSGWTSGGNRTAESDVRYNLSRILLDCTDDRVKLQRSVLQISRMKHEVARLRDKGQCKESLTFRGFHVMGAAVSCATKHLDMKFAAKYWWRNPPYTADPPTTGDDAMKAITIDWGSPGDLDYETFTGSIMSYEGVRASGETETIEWILVIATGEMRV